MKTILLQSCKPPPRPRWIERCLDSAAQWAERRGIPRLLIGDELFEGLPAAFMKLTRHDVLPRTDLGRLRWIERLHSEGWDRVIWLDADMFVFDETLDFTGDAVGREAWISNGDGDGFRVMRKVNNCILCFDAGSPHLARYLNACEAKAAGLTAPPAQRDFGPDLMTEMHFEAPFPLHADVAMFSPRVIEALAEGDGAALSAHAAAWGGAPKAANLCGSIGRSEEMMEAAINRLASCAAAAPERRSIRLEELRLRPDAPLAWRP